MLDLPDNASVDQVKDSYREKALKSHPKTDNSIDAQKRFRDIG